MKILFAASIPFPEGRANTRRIYTIAREMVNQGQQVSLLIPFARQPGPSFKIIDGIHVNWCHVPKSVERLKSENGRVRFQVQILSRIKFLFRFLRLSLRGEYDWLYLYQPGLEGLFAAFIARFTSHQVCSEYVDRLSLDDYPSIWLKVIYLTLVISDYFVPKLSSVIFVISSVLEQRYHQIAPQAQLILLPTLVDAQLFKTGNPEYYRNKLDLGVSKIVVYTGSFTRPQGVRNLIEAMSLVAQEHKDAYLLIAGGSLAYESDDVPALIKQFNLSEKVINLGQLASNEVIDLLASADIFVVPKLDDVVNHAGFSTKLAEFLAAGKPVVVSSVGDIPRYLHHRVDALLCEPGNVRELVTNISLLLSDKALADQIGKRGQMLAREKFDVKFNVTRMIAVLGGKGIARTTGVRE